MNILINIFSNKLFVLLFFFITILVLFFLILIGLYFWWKYYWFFRDPKRKIPNGSNIVSPADGTVIYIRKIERGEIPLSIKKGKKIKLTEISRLESDEFNNGYIIGIFMYPWSVHVNRSPIKGKVKQVSYFKNKNLGMERMLFRVFFKKKPFYYKSDHIIQNERNTIFIKGDFTAGVVQIADIDVNRIECWVKNNMKLEKGERLGLIKWGSQVDLILPDIKSLNFSVKEGDYVYAGKSVIAEY